MNTDTSNSIEHTFTVNGARRTVKAHPMKRLLDVLRDDLGFTGTKEGCGEGECGACSVLIDGKLSNSCLVPVIQANNREILTVEGYTQTPGGEIISQAFAESHSSQCGFCTPGMVMAAAALLKSNPRPNEDEIREALSGNICRCTGYDMIIDGILLSAQRGAEKGKEQGGGFAW